MKQELKCNICASENIIFIKQIQPYYDRKEWLFDIYECSDCHTRFSIDINLNHNNYHELLYKESYGYNFYYSYARKINTILNSGKTAECERYFKRISYFKYDEIIKYIKAKNRKLHILEIGSSTGFFTAYLRKCGHEALGVDISESAVNFAKELFGDFYSCQKPVNKKFDLIIHIGTIGCVPNPSGFLFEYLAFLNENGAMYFNAPYLSSIAKKDYIWVDTLPPDLSYIFSKVSFNKIFENTAYLLRFTEVLDYRKIVGFKRNEVFPSKKFQGTKAKESGFLTILPPLYRKFIEIKRIILKPLINWGLILPVYSEYGLFVEVSLKK